MTSARLAVVGPLVASLSLIVVACGPANPSSAPIAQSASPSVASLPSLTPVPGGSGSAPPSVPASAGQTDTEFGRIWDSLPPSFPKVPGSVPTEPGTGPLSGAFAVGSNVTTAAETVRLALVAQGYKVDVGSPLEDGTVVLDATGPDPACKIQVRFTPQAGSVIMTVLYGAACPFS